MTTPFLFDGVQKKTAKAGGERYGYQFYHITDENHRTDRAYNTVQPQKRKHDRIQKT